MRAIKTQPGIIGDPDPQSKQRVEITMSPREAHELLEDLELVAGSCGPGGMGRRSLDPLRAHLRQVTSSAAMVASMPPCEHCGRAFARWRTADGKSGWTRRHDPSCAKYASDGVGDVDTMTDEAIGA
jgi:hypothetical protein